jgi:DNA-binding response OmpR family regulator
MMTVVLIVEDDPLIAFDLSEMIAAGIGAAVLVAVNLAVAKRHLAGRVDFALLDINLGSETTFELARGLISKGIPFAFVSGSNRSLIPDDLKGELFLAKPCSAGRLVAATEAGLRRSRGNRTDRQTGACLR